MTDQQSGASADQEPQIYIIPDTTQLTVDDRLRIGAGNFWEDDFTDAEGKTTRGNTAGLWLFSREHPDQDSHQRVHEGSQLLFAGYLIVVLHVGSGKAFPRQHVIVGIEKVPIQA
ncbi:MAG: hypothetical protein U0528_01005 [Anaerolineae bacterium]